MCMGCGLWPLERSVSYRCTFDERGSLRRTSSYYFIFLHDLIIKNGTNGLLLLSFPLLEYLLLIVVEDHDDCNNLLLLPSRFPPYLTDPVAIYLIYMLSRSHVCRFAADRLALLIDRIGVPEFVPPPSSDMQAQQNEGSESVSLTFSTMMLTSIKRRKKMCALPHQSATTTINLLPPELPLPYPSKANANEKKNCVKREIRDERDEMYGG